MNFQSQNHHNVYGICCHMWNNVTNHVLKCTLGYIDDEQLHHKCHLMILGVRVHLLIS